MTMLGKTTWTASTTSTGDVNVTHLNSANLEHLEQNTTLATPESGDPLEGVVSRELFILVELVLDAGFNLSISCLGIISNILTIAVFSKMGFKETVNISMTVIAIWDLVKCISIGIFAVTIPLQHISMDFGIWWLKLTGVPFRCLNNTAGNVSGILAAYVALERCLCVCMPFSVKSILTRKVVIVTSLMVSILVPASYLVIFLVYEAVEITDASTNETFVIYQQTSLGRRFPTIMLYSAVMSTLYPLVTLVITVVCTAIIQYRLKKASKFRSKMAAETTSGKSSPHQLSPRDRQVIKMLVVIILAYIVCVLPRVALYVVQILIPEFDAGARYNNVYMLSLYFMGVFDAANASINIFIFYSMSSQFKSTMKQMFHFGEKGN